VGEVIIYLYRGQRENDERKEKEKEGRRLTKYWKIKSVQQ
jgi:hypothetical protein